MSVTTILDRLAAIQETITGVTRAYASPPYSLPDSDLPIFINFVGAASLVAQRGGSVDEVREYAMALYVCTVQDGISGEAAARLYPFFDRVRDAFLSRPLLGLGSAGSNAPFVIDAEWRGDKGLTATVYAGTQYLGTEFRIRVETLTPVNYISFD